MIEKLSTDFVVDAIRGRSKGENSITSGKLKLEERSLNALRLH